MDLLKDEVPRIQEDFEELRNQEAFYDDHLMREDRDIEYEAYQLNNRKMCIEEEVKFLAQEREAVNMALMENSKRSKNLAGEKEEMDQMFDEERKKLRKRKAVVKEILVHVKLSKQAVWIWQKSIEKKKEDLTCTICLEVSKTPIYTCPESHIICSTCATIPELNKCPECCEDLPTPLKRHRFAEKIAEELEELLEATEILA